MNASYGWDGFVADSSCFLDDPQPQSTCNFTEGMVSFLNLTGIVGGASEYIAAYCLNPPADDLCPFKYCANPDVAGPLVRIGAYFSNIFLSMQIFYSPDDIHDAFLAQILTISSLLLATAVSLLKRELSKFHAVLASILIGSPVTLYLFVYSLMSVFHIRHRLSDTLGHKGLRHRPARLKGLLARSLVLVLVAIWVSTVFFVFTAGSDRFSQPSCDKDWANILISRFYGALLFYVWERGMASPWLWVIMITPIALIAVSWTIAIFKQRKFIWTNGYSLRFWTVWRIVGDRYPFIHATSVIIMPTFYWIGSIELGLLSSRDNDGWSISFGQVLAVFIVVQPAISVAPLVGEKLIPWFGRLTWVRACCRHLRRGRVRRLAQSQLIWQPQKASGKRHGRRGSEAPMVPPMRYASSGFIDGYGVYDPPKMTGAPRARLRQDVGRRT